MRAFTASSVTEPVGVRHTTVAESPACCGSQALIRSRALVDSVPVRLTEFEKALPATLWMPMTATSNANHATTTITRCLKHQRASRATTVSLFNFLSSETAQHRSAQGHATRR